MKTSNPLIYGKDPTPGVTSIQVTDEQTFLFKNDGSIETRPTEYWFLTQDIVDTQSIQLKGQNYFQYANTFKTLKEFKTLWGMATYAMGIHGWCAWNLKEQFMLRSGVTYYKNLTPKDVSILSFDIETTSLKPSDNDKILLISNTFRDNKGNIEKRLFCYDDFKSTKEMVYAWTSFVQEKNPDILCGHNIFSFDIPYIEYYVRSLPVGRNKQPIETSKNPREFRKDGSQTITYYDKYCFGREIIDTMFLSYKYDAASRKYESYGLKPIMRAEGLEKADRQFYDASKIRFKYQDPTEWEKIKAYAIDDADDALALFDLMIPSYFYFCQSIPKPMQEIINGASGAQVNSWLMRSYLQQGMAVPAASENFKYEGAISFGNPGSYQNVKKVDVASLYPSIILEQEIYDKSKDPNKHFLQMVQYFTTERLQNKKLAKETGDKYYKDLEQSQKIFINSAYGFLGSTGLNFNGPKHAEHITARGREILTIGMNWAETKGFKVINADTDSFCYTGSVNFQQELTDLNNLYGDKIKWEDDGTYSGMVIVAAKNYAMKSNGKITIKGSGLKATMKEPALKEFTETVLHYLLDGRKEDVVDLYEQYADEIKDITKDNITRWCNKKTVTKAILNPKRTNESRPAEAIAGKGLQEGDKFYVFFETPEIIRCKEDFNGIYDKKTLYKKLYSTIKIFDSVLDLKKFNNYSLTKFKRI